MNWMDTVGGLLQQYTGSNANAQDTENHFDQVSNAVPSSALGGALADMFRSSDTPPFAQLAAQMFGNANGAQKATVLNELLAAAGPALPGILANAGLGNLLGGGPVSAADAEQVPTEVVQQVAQHVEQHDPSIVDRLGAIYSEHPTLIKTLGSAALAVTLAKLANRSQS